MPKIKICGIRTLCDVEYINEAAPDYTGFVFAPSKRQIDAKSAREFKKHLRMSVKTVGVFVNPALEEISAVIDTIDLIQLHGNEDEDYIKLVQKEFKKPVIKAFCGGMGDINTEADFILLDSADDKAFGGTGRVFDWKNIGKLNKPLFLAGGINIGNIDKAKALNPYCIDVSSGAESMGSKDKNKILEIVKRARQ